MGIHHEYPFAHLYRIDRASIPEEVLCFLWYLVSVYSVGITLDVQWLYYYLNNIKHGEKDCLLTFLSMFAPLSGWNGILRRSAKEPGLSYKKLKEQGIRGPNPFFNPHTIYFFHRPLQINARSNKLHALPTLIHHKDYQRGIRPDFNVRDNKLYEEFQLHAFRLNNARKNFAIPYTTNWYYYPVDYQMTLDEALQHWMMEGCNMHPKYAKRPASEITEEKQLTLDYQPEQETTQDDLKEQDQSQNLPLEYFQDAQDPNDDEMNIDEITKKFNIKDDSDDFEEPEMEYICPGDEPGCCDYHIIKFEMDH